MSKAEEQHLSVKFAQQASDLFGKKGFCAEYLDAFLQQFAAARFAHVCAFSRGARGADDAVMAARVMSTYRGDEEIYLKADDIDYILQNLRRPEYKKPSDRGECVTQYPKLVEALIDAKRNLKLYDTTEMQAYLRRCFDGAAQNGAAGSVSQLKLSDARPSRP